LVLSFFSFFSLRILVKSKEEKMPNPKGKIFMIGYRYNFYEKTKNKGSLGNKRK